MSRLMTSEPGHVPIILLTMLLQIQGFYEELYFGLRLGLNVFIRGLKVVRNSN